jgi:hypothetical protein
MGIYSDPTANAAIGSINKEYNRLRKKATQIKALRQAGKLTKQQEAALQKEFAGIFRNLLEESDDPENKS